MNTKINRATTTTTPTILGEQRPEKQITLRPAPTAAELRAALAAANLDIPKKPEKPAKPANNGRRGRARITLSAPLSEAFHALGWDAPTRPTLLAVPQLSTAMLDLPVPAQPAKWSVSGASLLLLAHSANGLLPSLAEGQTVTLSNFLIVVHDLRQRGGFATNRVDRTGDVSYISAPDLFFRALGGATYRMTSLDYVADTIRLVSAKD